MSNTRYYFLSAVRQGLASGITRGATGARAQVDVDLQATVRNISDRTEVPKSVPKTVQLYGPGDILGFDERIVSRCYPQPDVGDFEPNYFPAIEFADPDFAWRYTADKATNNNIGQLDPWITLIVLAAEDQDTVVEREFEEGVHTDQNLPPYIKVDRLALPHLGDVWHWAHVHVNGAENLSEDDVFEILRTQPERAVCRLLCPRRLAPKVRYNAFVVPTFTLGVLAGRGLPLGPNVSAVEPAWKHDDSDKSLPYYDAGSGQLELPYYYRWEFRTSVRGDFEYLVRLLEPRKLSGLGVRNIDCEKPGFEKPGVDRDNLEPPEKHYLSLEGALKSLNTQYTEWGADADEQPAALQQGIAVLINGLEVPWSIEETDAINNITLRAYPDVTTVTIRWYTPDLRTSRVEYGETSGYGNSEEDLDFKRRHRITLQGFTRGATYHFRIVTRGEDGGVAQTADGWLSVPQFTYLLPSVVPPIYGRWHAGRGRVDPHRQEVWLDVLNLDPRHRVAAGFGSEVVRKQQEALMASAWDQLGPIESANDILRRAQFGRDTSNWLYQRLGHLATEDFLRVTGPAQRRVVPDGEYETVTEELRTQSRIPAAALDPAFRRIMRPRGPLRKRQRAGRSVDLLERLASGDLVAAVDAPKPLGTTRLCDITRQLRDSVPNVELSAEPPTVNVGERSTLKWTASNCVSCWASDGDWQGTWACTEGVMMYELDEFEEEGEYTYSLTCKSAEGITTTRSVTVIVTPAPPPHVIVQLLPVGPAIRWEAENCESCTARAVPPLPQWQGHLNCSGQTSISGLGLSEGITYELCVDCVGPGGTGSACLHITVDSNGNVGEIPTAVVRLARVPGESEDPWLTFCDRADGFISCQKINEAIAEHSPFDGIENAPDTGDTADIVCGALNEWLEKPPEHPETKPPTHGTGFTDEIKNTVYPALNPNRTMVERAKKRLRLTSDLAMRFEEGAKGDPLDPIMWAPEFSQAMYEPLRDISHELLLPGVEKVPQNTIGILEPNRRFLEAYMCGLNHEFAGELLWRKYPTDQRGSYFRQFWDVGEYVPREDERQQLLEAWLAELNARDEREIKAVADLTREEKSRILRHYMEERFEEVLDRLIARWLAEAGATEESELSYTQKGQLRWLRLYGLDAELSDVTLNAFTEELMKIVRLEEKLKDITHLVRWRGNALGENRTRPDETLVLLIRGDLLKRYPNAMIYAIDAVPGDCEQGELVPGLPEYLKCYMRDAQGNISNDSNGNPIVDENAVKETLQGIRRIYPVFRAVLPPDLTFFGFPFGEDEARNGQNGRGKYLVIEEPASEPRFGLDTPTDATPLIGNWNDLSWANFGFGTQEGEWHYGGYIDNPPGISGMSDDKKDEWNEASAARRARITCQKPVRVAVHAAQMLPSTAAEE